MENVDPSASTGNDLNSKFTDPLKSGVNIALNKQTYVTYLDKICLVNGVAAGVLQLESLRGFLQFFVVYFACALIYVLIICKRQPSRFYEGVVNDLIFANVTRELMGFVMAWTFSYALIN
ncbi:Emc6p KNAG_0H02560 [Huiozyma naganishii CBS 8797]|uniref:ER membrane protein complex subunit 6 n=1 Tax=Huiozyma naganishii (strain ATCC MYA-139 / BCRC 22969 / CBS 8797 / KCTC 17520 / NBRC 10181 / NCYC 3082 / Yp74L-3) TaxID=1071383 RepID=J7S9S1_HUIN7|nr:hypothetical protein KNAG_0H02560 [Kazachstania naganishii CBS 8797]CCK71671.1 hypothetical protein KNAG_0H02560 [Kazachstania naganishii CBS 8797]